MNLRLAGRPPGHCAAGPGARLRADCARRRRARARRARVRPQLNPRAGRPCGRWASARMAKHGRGAAPLVAAPRHATHRSLPGALTCFRIYIGYLGMWSKCGTPLAKSWHVTWVLLMDGPRHLCELHRMWRLVAPWRRCCWSMHPDQACCGPARAPRSRPAGRQQQARAPAEGVMLQG